MANHPVAKSITPGSRALSSPINTNYTAINNDTIAHIEGTDFRHPGTAVDVDVRNEALPITSAADTLFNVLSQYAAMYANIYGPMRDAGNVVQTGYANRANNQITGGNL